MDNDMKPVKATFFYERLAWEILDTEPRITVLARAAAIY
jgi:hypothetical protein